MNWDDLKFFESEKYIEICSFLEGELGSGTEILPEPDEILNALHYTPLDRVKVVILGQDPYPTPGHAHGLCFSVRPDVSPLPRSLRNIFRELQDDLGVPEPQNGCLVPWAQQGVLLLNTSLTVEAHNANSHGRLGWGLLANEIVKTVSHERNHVAFLLWGKHAQAKGTYVNRRKHLILESAHPSPFSAERGFFGSRPFSKANLFLEENNLEPIDWSLAKA